MTGTALAAVVVTFCLAAVMSAPAPAAAATNGAGFYVRGGGFGPGIGMSAYGDAGYAQHGWSYRRILAHYYAGTSVGHVRPTRVVNVLLGQGSPSFSGATRIAGSRKRLSSPTRYRVLARGARLRVLAGRKVVGTFRSPLRVGGPGPLRLVGMGRYRGSLVFRPVGGQVQTVNAVGADDYVRGVLSAEMPPSWPMQALEALATAARTVGLVTQVAPDDYNVYDDTRSQNYRGVAAETARTNAAVANTSGEVVTYRGQMVEVLYFASSGGYTESIQNVWPGTVAEPWLHGEPDPYDGAFGDPYHRWHQNLRIATAEAKLVGRFRGSLRGIRVLRTGVSPRIVSARIVGSRGSSTVSGAALQAIFGTLSTNMDFTTIRIHAHVAGDYVSGSVYPVLRRERVTIQRRRAGRWVKAGRVRPRAGGGYRLTVTPGASYRAVYHGVDGPIVHVG